MKKITHIITDLNTGGAEMMLLKLLSRIDTREISPEVISLTDIGKVGEEMQKIGIPVRALGMRRPLPNPVALFRLVGWLKKNPPDIVQTWMYHADLMGGLAVKLARVPSPLVWGIRVSDLDSARTRKTTLLTARINALFSRWIPETIICCSEASREIHENLGYKNEKMVVIPNGFDTEFFRPDSRARASLREELGLDPNALLVGIVARFDPQKDYETFVRAAGLVHERFPEIHFVLCGKDVTGENQELISWIQEAGIEERVHLLGLRTDTNRIMAAFDIGVLSSAYGEGFPNVVGEAMSCGVPCVVTNVGESAAIVGDTGLFVNPRNYEKLAHGVKALLKLSREHRRFLGEKARERIQVNYTIDRIAEEYLTLYQTLCKT